MAEFPTPLFSKAIEEAVLDDKLWFARNPEREFRLRDMRDFEFNFPWDEKALPGTTWRVLVANMRTVGRARTPICVDASAQNEAPDDFLEPIFRQAAPPELVEKFDALRR